MAVFGANPPPGATAPIYAFGDMSLQAPPNLHRLDLVKADVIRSPIIELIGAVGALIGHGRGRFEMAAVLYF